MTNIKKNIFITAFACCMVLHFSACKTASRTAGTTPDVKERVYSPEEYLLNKIDFNAFSGKASIDIRNKDDRQSLTTNIRMRKDRDIWSSVMALGGMVEVARALITTDSLKAIVRIGKKSYRLSYEEGLKLIQAEIEFPALQNLIMGNPLVSEGEIKNVEQTDSLITISIEKDGYRQALTYGKRSHLLQKLDLSSAEKDFSCVIDFKDYKPLALKQPFAYSRDIHIRNKGESVYLKMNFDRADIDVPVDMGFSIPDSYTPGKL